MKKILELHVHLDVNDEFFKFKSKNNQDKTISKQDWLKSNQLQINVSVTNYFILEENEKYYTVIHEDEFELQDDNLDLSIKIFKEFKEDELSLFSVTYPDYKFYGMNAVIYVTEGEELKGKELVRNRMIQWIETMKSSIISLEQAVNNFI